MGTRSIETVFNTMLQPAANRDGVAQRLADGTEMAGE
jgi:hypothetical protein